MSEPNASQFRLSSRPVLLCLLLAAATLAVFWPVRNYDFIGFDDPAYFSENTHVQSGLTAAGALWAFKTGYAGNWHPLTWLSLMLDAELFGNHPGGPHFVNLLLHAANTALLFLLLRRLTAATWRSALVAALFALHPLHVESVAWIAERKDVLSLFFELLALLAYARYAQTPAIANHASGFRLPASGHYWLALVFCGLAIMGKPMAVTLPFLLLLLDWWPLGRIAEFELRSAEPGSAVIFKRLLIEKIPFFALSAAASIVTFAVQQKAGAVATLTKISAVARVENAFVSYVRYLEKTLWPAGLAIPYPHPGYWPLSLVLPAVVVFVAFSMAAVRVRRRFPFAITGWFWFVGTLIPVIGVVQVGGQSMADRYTYLPLIGIFIVLVWGAAEARARWRMSEQVMVLSAVIVLAVCAARTRSQLNYWHDDNTLFRHALDVTENNYVASVNLGTWLSKQGQVQAAMDCYYRALRMSPSDPTVLYDVGNAFTRLGRLDEAIGNYRLALAATPDQPDILDNLGFALAAKKQYAEAVTNFEAALKINPDSTSAHNNLATVLFIQKRFADAAQHYRAALASTPDNPQIWANLGDTLIRLNQPAAAAQSYQQALALKPDDARTKAKLQSLGVP